MIPTVERLETRDCPSGPPALPPLMDDPVYVRLRDMTEAQRRDRARELATMSAAVIEQARNEWWLVHWQRLRGQDRLREIRHEAAILTWLARPR